MLSNINRDYNPECSLNIQILNKKNNIYGPFPTQKNYQRVNHAIKYHYNTAHISDCFLSL